MIKKVGFINIKQMIIGTILICVVLSGFATGEIVLDGNDSTVTIGDAVLGDAYLDITNINSSSGGDILLDSDDELIFTHDSAYVDFKSENGVGDSGIQLWDDTTGSGCMSQIKFGYDNSGVYVQTGRVGDGSSGNQDIFLSALLAGLQLTSGGGGDINVNSDDELIFTHDSGFVDFKSENGAGGSGIQLWDDTTGAACISQIKFGYDNSGTFVPTARLGDGSAGNQDIFLSALLAGLQLDSGGGGDINVNSDDELIFTYDAGYAYFKSENGAGDSGIQLWDDRTGAACMSQIKFGYDNSGTFVPTARLGDAGSSNSDIYLISEVGNLHLTSHTGIVLVNDIIQLANSTSAPGTPADGMIAYADGTSWNPGGGRGFYGYYNATWNKMG